MNEGVLTDINKASIHGQSPLLGQLLETKERERTKEKRNRDAVYVVINKCILCEEDEKRGPIY